MRWLRSHMLREAASLALLVLALFVADALCYQVALPVKIDVQGHIGTLHVGNQTVQLGTIATPIALQFAPHDPVIHEYQLDGTDSTNNFTLDPAYLHDIASSPYYRFQEWMRDLDGTSRWRDLHIWANGRSLGGAAWPQNGSRVLLPPSSSLRISLILQRPETPMTLDLITTGGVIIHITLDRNDRQIVVTRYIPGQGDNLPVTSTFFPVDSASFVAVVLDSLIRILLWAIVALLVVLTGEVGIACIRILLTSVGAFIHYVPHGTLVHAPRALGIALTRRNPIHNAWQRLTTALHPIAFVALIGSFAFVAWIARVQYNAEPHIFDASAYLFAAKMYAAGHLSVPIPPAADRFPGPFMVQFHDRWFAQYAPGTALTLVPGIWLGVPWLVEPILGTLALLGIGLVAARLYDRRVATLAVLLGTLSPFYSYLAASYLSHAIALFYLVGGLWALVRFVQGEASWNMPLAGALFGMAGLTRDLVAVLFVAIVLPGILILFWRQLRFKWLRWVAPGVAFFGLLAIFVGINWGFNAAVTGSPWLTPRSLFFAGDHWGFGSGVGFYGQHTLAAGFVNLDELLTSLQIDLFGWPFYLTLAFLALPFLTRRVAGADWLMLAGAVLMIGAYVGYFYHGIYLGPRYLFETLPFLLILTARGILTLATTGLAAGRALTTWFSERLHTQRVLPPCPVSAATVALVIVLVACNLLYYLPRQVTLHQDYSGLPNGYQIDLSAAYTPPVHHAIVVTGDFTLYQFVLFPLNDPLLSGDVIYALASSPSDYAELRSAFPGRTLYRLDIAGGGSVHYKALGPPFDSPDAR